MIKIAISGKANSGKNTVTNMLINSLHVSNSVRIRAFADPIKNMAVEMIPNCNETCLFGPSEMRQNVVSNNFFDESGAPLTYRRILMDIGKLGRIYNKDLWIDKLKEDLEKHKNNVKAYFVSDLRFINEAEFLKSAGFITIRIKRDLSLKLNDISETQQDEMKDTDFDFVIDNNSSLTTLETTINQVAAQILKKPI